MPFLTEEMYHNLVGGVDKTAPESIHLCDFPVSEKKYIDESLEDEVAVTRAIVSLGRSARSKANIKIRQPLDEMIVNIPQAEFTLTKDDEAVILEELNIKKIKTAEPNALETVLTYEVSPKFDLLGPKFGEELNKVVGWIKSWTQDDIQKFVQCNFLKHEIDGKVLEITQDDVEVKKVEKPGWSIMIEDEFGVGVNTSISAGLQNEGLVRELIHKIQLMRKEANFNLVDRIKIFYQTDAKLKQAIEANLDYLKNETLAVEVTEGAVQGETSSVLNINGIETKVSLQRVKTS
jgi:isoleucyl-tRNA synthetase